MPFTDVPINNALYLGAYGAATSRCVEKKGWMRSYLITGRYWKKEFRRATLFERFGIRNGESRRGPQTVSQQIDALSRLGDSPMFEDDDCYLLSTTGVNIRKRSLILIDK